MYSIFDNNIDNIAHKRPFYGKLPAEHLHGYTWDRHIKLIDTHPHEQLAINTDKMRIGLGHFHERRGIPHFARGIDMAMQAAFVKYGYQVTNIAFAGFGPHNESYPKHRDAMDVFLLQVLGEIKIEIDGLHDDLVPFVPGDYYWIPRGTYHRIIPTMSRVTFSFGVEGEPDPSIQFAK